MRRIIMMVLWWMMLLQVTASVEIQTQGKSVAESGNLLCTFGQNGLVHLRLTQKMLIDGEDLGTTIESIASYRLIAGKTLAALYELGLVKRLNPLWMLTLYIDLVRFYRCYNDVNVHEAQEVTFTEDEQRRITDYLLNVHKFVTSELVALTETECPSSDFRPNADEYHMNSLTDTEYSQAMRMVIDENVKRILESLEKHHQFKFQNLEPVTTSIFYLNDFGSRADVVHDVTKGYAVHVTWNDVPQKLLESWQKSHDPSEWPTKGFYSLKDYYKRTTDLVKTVMLRLTLKHIFHLRKRMANEDFSKTTIANNPNSEDNVNVLKWFVVLTDFVKLFDLGADPHCNYLINSYNNPVHLYSDGECKNIIRAIKKHLLILSKSQGCEANGALWLDDKPPVLQLNTVQDLTSILPPLEPQSPPIQNNSIRIGVAFVNHMKQIFVNVDFKLIRLFLQNADDIQKFKVPQ